MTELIKNEQIGERIRVFRIKAGMTQEKLAEALEITYQQVQRFERGSTKINVLMLQHIADALKVPISAFFDNHGEVEYAHNESEIQLLQAYRKIRDESTRDSVINIVHHLSQQKK